jgi:aminoglycoside 3-N-acetyltransferase
MEFSQAEATAAIEQALEPGDDVLIHASLSGIGRFSGEIDRLVQSFVDAVTQTGTVIMMTDTRSFARTGRFSIDMPSETGLLTERFRLRPGARRSCVPMISFAAEGARQADYTQPYHSHLDETSPIRRLLEKDGKILLFGIGYEKCTLYHLSEERLESEYNTYKTFEGGMYDGAQRVSDISQRYFVRRDMSTKKDPSIAGRMLEDRDQARVIPLGRDALRVFKARDFDRCCMDALRADPNAFLADIGK